MVDIEPMLTYDYSNFGIRNIISICTLLYIAFIYPLYSILNYDIKTEKELVRNIVLNCLNVSGCSIHKVSKENLILDKDIIYMTNHLSVGDFFIDTYVGNYTFKFIALNKMKYILPILGLICYFTSFTIFISCDNKKEKIIENFKNIEQLRKNDDIRNLALYPEGLRRPHRHTVSNSLKKGFIYHSFENNLPIQIIHTTNKDYVIDDEKIIFHKNTKLFTYYGSKIDPQKLKLKFEKKHKRDYTKDDYYNDVYKQWSKIWSKMDKYRIDTLRSKGLSHEESLQKMEYYATKFPKIEDKIVNDDKPLSMSFLFFRSTLWSIIYFIIFKIVERFFSTFSSFYKLTGNNCNKINSNNNSYSSIISPYPSPSKSLSASKSIFGFMKLPILPNFLFSHTSL